MNNKYRVGLLLATTALVIAAGCTRHVSRGISPQGQAEEIVFPELDTIVLQDGTFPNLDNLRQIGPGVTKDQLYALIGRPHFREGYFHVREWDYMFHFRKGSEIVTCQYKVIFDKNYLGQSFHWAPASCAELLEDSKQMRRFSLSADALFAFARHEATDILPEGREQLASIAEQLKAVGDVSVRVVGHTDRIGGEGDNFILSQRRANTVRVFLIDHGVNAANILALGRGESEPQVDCEPSLAHEALVGCLQPNRRVEIVVEGTKDTP